MREQYKDHKKKLLCIWGWNIEKHQNSAFEYPGTPPALLEQ